MDPGHDPGHHDPDDPGHDPGHFFVHVPKRSLNFVVEAQFVEGGGAEDQPE